MKNFFFVVALLIMGGYSLSAASTANALPALKSISAVADTKSGVQNVTYDYWHWKRHHYGHYDHGHYGYNHYHYYKPYYYKRYYYKPHYYKHGHYRHHYYPKQYYWHHD